MSRRGTVSTNALLAVQGFANTAIVASSAVTLGIRIPPAPARGVGTDTPFRLPHISGEWSVSGNAVLVYRFHALAASCNTDDD